MVIIFMEQIPYKKIAWGVGGILVLGIIVGGVFIMMQKPLLSDPELTNKEAPSLSGDESSSEWSGLIPEMSSLHIGSTTTPSLPPREIQELKISASANAKPRSSLDEVTRQELFDSMSVQ